MPLYSPFPGFATNAEAQAQVLVDRAVTPANLAQRAAFSVNRNGIAQGGIASATDTKILWGAEVVDVGGFFDLANSRWVPPVGNVDVSARLYFFGATAGTPFYMKIFKNGAVLAEQIVYASPSGDNGASIRIIDTANGTDYYELYVSGTTGATITVGGSNLQTVFLGGVV